jgi:peptide/nickel transport system substrate-binding protein
MAAAILVILLSFVCASPPPPPPTAAPAPKAAAAAAKPAALTAASQASAPKRGGRLTVGVPADVKAMDPHLSSGGGAWRAQLTSLYDTALMLDPVDLALKPNLVKTWEWADLKTLKVTVQDGVTFHNGARMTAEDLKWNIDRVRDGPPSTPSPSTIPCT